MTEMCLFKITEQTIQSTSHSCTGSCSRKRYLINSRLCFLPCIPWRLDLPDRGRRSPTWRMSGLLWGTSSFTIWMTFCVLGRIRLFTILVGVLIHCLLVKYLEHGINWCVILILNWYLWRWWLGCRKREQRLPAYLVRVVRKWESFLSINNVVRPRPAQSVFVYSMYSAI